MLEHQADLLANNVRGWEQSVINRIATRIGKTRKMTIADIKALNNVAFIKEDMDAIVKDLAKTTKLNVSQVEKMYGDVIAQQHENNRGLYDYRKKKFVSYSESKELQSLVQGFAKSTSNTMINLSKIGATHLGFIDKYGKFVPISKFYSDALDKAVMQVSSGAVDFHSAMRDTISAMGGNGLRVNYGGGITRRLDTAVRQALLWGAKQTSIAYNERISDELGCDGIEIDWHSFPRPSHEFMQGKQYALGKAKKINGVLYESAYEALERLSDYGCLHFKTPIICGISEPTYSPQELARLDKQNKQIFEIDGKKMTGYEVTQAMRRFETSVREQKSIREGARRSGDDELVKDCTKRIKLYQAKYDEICTIANIPPQPQRMSITRT